MKKTIKLSESQLKKMVKEALLSEIGDTEKGQEALGALHAKHVYKNARDNYKKTGKIAHPATNDELEIYNYAEKKRKGNDKLNTAFAKGYVKQQDKEFAKGLNESQLISLVKESILKALNEVFEKPDNWKDTPFNG